jgi:nicotinamide riboside transporter PnuC
MFHEGGTVCHVFAKRINLIEWFLGIVALGQFVPIHFQGKCAVTY